MQDESLFKVLSHLDAPARILGLTLDDAAVCGLTMFMIMFSSHKVLVGITGFLLRMLVKYIRRGNSPSWLFLLAYWHLPSFVTRHISHGVPPSHQRYWTS